MDENKSEAPALSPPKVSKIRGSILKRKIAEKDDSSLDSSIIEKSGRKSRRVSFAAAPQIRMFQKEMRHKSIGGSVVSLRKKEYRKKTADMKEKYLKSATLDTDDNDNDIKGAPRHRFSIASNRDTETVSIDTILNNADNTISIDNSKRASPMNKKITTNSVTTVTNSPVRRSPRLNRNLESLQPSLSLCDILLKPSNTAENTTVDMNETTMNVDISYIIEKLDSKNESTHQMLTNVEPLKVTIDHDPTNYSQKKQNQIEFKENIDNFNLGAIKHPSNSAGATSNEDWSMNISPNNNSSLQTHNLLTMDDDSHHSADADELTPVNILMDVSSMNVTDIENEKNPVFYQVKSSDSSFLDTIEDHTDLKKVDNLSNELISLLDTNKDNKIGQTIQETCTNNDKNEKDNADIIYETFLNKSSWFLDKISEINMDYTAKRIQCGSFNETSNCVFENNVPANRFSNLTLFDDKHQLTDNDVVDMDISSYSSCTHGIGQLANDAKETFIALNSLLNLTHMTEINNTSECYHQNENFNHKNPSCGIFENSLSFHDDHSSFNHSLTMPSLLDDSMFEGLLLNIQKIRQNIENFIEKLSENLNTNQAKFIQPLYNRNSQVETSNIELRGQINELFKKLSEQKRSMAQLQMEETSLSNNIQQIELELNEYASEVDKKLVINNIETELLFSSLRLLIESRDLSDKNILHINFGKILKLSFQYDHSHISIIDVTILPWLTNTIPIDMQFLSELFIQNSNILLEYFSGCNSDRLNLFTNKIKHFSIKIYHIYTLFNIIHDLHIRKYPMEFVFCYNNEKVVQFSFNLYYKCHMYSCVSLRLSLNHDLDCIISSYNLTDMFNLYESDKLLACKLKHILDNAISKPLLPYYVHTLFSLLENIVEDFHSYVTIHYCELLNNS